MIAGEQEAITIEVDGVTTRVSGNRNHDQIVVDPDRVGALRLDFHRLSATRHVIVVQDTSAGKPSVELLVIGHVVPMSQKHRADSSQTLDVLGQRGGEPGRVDEYVPGRSD